MQSEINSFRNIRHIDKTFYLWGDERFYERNYDHYTPSDELMSLLTPILAGQDMVWHTHRADVWTHVVPDRALGDEDDTPQQGWKIHISATNLNCPEILVIVAELAVACGIQFKFANDVETLRLMTSKRWHRGGSGKFMTVYPRTVSQFHQFIEACYNALSGYRGSYILSDRRYKDSHCVYYRYGGIKPNRRLDFVGRKHEVLMAPDGREVPDVRNAYFDLPDWELDPYPDLSSDQGRELTLDNGKFEVKSALAFSNTGGVYLATDTKTGTEVVIKEARPGVELGVTGDDATSRLQREAEILNLLANTGISPRVHTMFWDWENLYLVEEYLQGEDMRLVMLKNTPLLRVNPTAGDSNSFYRVYKAIIIGLLTAVDRFHEEGVIIGDLSPVNVLFDELSMSVRIIDLEGAYRPGTDTPQTIYTPGFRAHTKGRAKELSFSDDLYAVGVIMMYSMFPIAAMSYIRADVFANVLPTLVQNIGWERTPVLPVIQKLVANEITCREAISELSVHVDILQPSDRHVGEKAIPPLAEIVQGLASFITKTYRLDERYTLFPIDPFGAYSNPLGLMFGATGVVYSLAKCDVEVPPEALERYSREIDRQRLDDLPPGFVNGTAGMAWGLLSRGKTEPGLRFLRHANASPLAEAHHSLYYGMAGIGMANLAAYRSTGEPTHLDQALMLAETLARSAVTDSRGMHWLDNGKVRIGYGYGQAGVALFFLRLSQVLDDPRWRNLGQAALEYDLSYITEIEAGVMSISEFPENTHTMEQYIEQGSGGVAKVAIRYGMWEKIDGLLNDVHRKYSGFPGLIYGLSGFVDVLTDAYIYSRDRKYLDMAQRPIRGLIDLYLFDTPEGLAVPGENLFRISCDYATGIAGVMATLYRHNHLISDELCLDVLDQIDGRQI